MFYIIILVNGCPWSETHNSQNKGMRPKFNEILFCTIKLTEPQVQFFQQSWFMDMFMNIQTGTPALLSMKTVLRMIS